MATRTGQHSQGNRLARLREAQGLSRKELAAMIPTRYGGRRGTVNERTIRNWENQSIPERHWNELAEIFSVSVSHLLGLDANGNGGTRERIRSVA